MAIAKMKRLRVIAPQQDCRRLLKDLTRIGCVEVERTDGWMNDPELSSILSRRERDGESARALSEITGALDALSKFADVKKSIFDPRRQIGEGELYDGELTTQAVVTAGEINTLSRSIASMLSEESRISGVRAGLLPWAGMDIPVDFKTKGSFLIRYGSLSALCDLNALPQRLEKAAPASELAVISSDREQHYVVLVTHRSCEEAALDVLKADGFSEAIFKDMTGTIAQNIAQLDEQLVQLQSKQQLTKEKILSYKDAFQSLGLAFDHLTLQSQFDEIDATLGATQKTVYLEGWVPDRAQQNIEDLLQGGSCAWEIVEAEKGEAPPVLLENNRVVAPFGQITELYGIPPYDSVVDPNPFVAASYFLFFGMMFSDAAYGLLMVFGALWFLKKAKPTGGLAMFAKLAVFVGISTTLWGAAFGSWFGDIIPVVSARITGVEYNLPFIFDPLSDPVTMLIISLGFGIIHLFIGLGLAGYRMIKRGHALDAVFDILPWYCVVIGALLFLLGVSFGLKLLAAALVLVLLTAGRSNQGFGKVTGGLGAIYSGVTGYIADILSYSRLMALALSTGVVASVINTLGNMLGSSVFGWLFLIFIFLGGQVFNFAISILGAFVHSCRLEFVEFFGKFYESGGRKFKPLFFQTKYTQIVKEKN